MYTWCVCSVSLLTILNTINHDESPLKPFHQVLFRPYRILDDFENAKNFEGPFS